MNLCHQSIMRGTIQNELDDTKCVLQSLKLNLYDLILEKRKNKLRLSICGFVDPKNMRRLYLQHKCGE